MKPEQDIFFDALYREYYRRLYLYALNNISDSDFAEDVVQDTFHELILHIDDLMQHENPGGWLINTLKNKMRENDRMRRRYVRRFLSFYSMYFEEPQSGQSLEDSVLDTPVSEQVLIREISQILTPEEFDFFKRIVFQKASHKTIAQELGITVWASQKRLERIRKKLKKHL